MTITKKKKKLDDGHASNPEYPRLSNWTRNLVANEGALYLTRLVFFCAAADGGETRWKTANRKLESNAITWNYRGNINEKLARSCRD